MIKNPRWRFIGQLVELGSKFSIIDFNFCIEIFHRCLFVKIGSHSQNRSIASERIQTARSSEEVREQMTSTDQPMLGIVDLSLSHQTSRGWRDSLSQQTALLDTVSIGMVCSVIITNKMPTSVSVVVFFWHPDWPFPVQVPAIQICRSHLKNEMKRIKMK